MYVLDYLRPIEGHALVVPPFHTGPCGLLPGAQVHVSMAESAEGMTVLVRPYQSSLDNLTLLTCILRNHPPAEVTRVMDPVSELGINILNAFSSVIDDLNEQHVCMVLDWSTSKDYARKRPSSPADRRRYRDYHSVFPVAQERYVKLYEAIERSCGAQMARRPGDPDLPALTLEEIPNPPNLLPCGAPEVQRHSARYHVKIELPTFLLTKLRISLGVEDDESLRYFLLSDASTRTLRAFFPRHATTRDSVHLAFFHVDAPGTFAAILHPFVAAGFKILTSVVRHDKDGRNVLDALMQVPPDILPEALRRPGGGGLAVTEELCAWAARLALEYAQPADVGLYRRCQLEIGPPMYPAPKAGDWSGTVSVGALLESGEVAIGSKRPARPAASAEPVNGIPRPPEDAPLSKAEFVRRQIASHRERGMSAAELYLAFQHAGVPIQRSYLHSLLHRLREQKSLRYFDRRYFPEDE
jgi:ACT domain-containing protein